MLLDSAAYYAILDQQETTHPQAAVVLRQLAHERWRLFTTNFIVAEAHALILGRLGYHHATAFLRQFEEGATTVLRVRQTDEERAKQIIYQYRDKRFSMTDATSFAVMEQHRIGVAFTFDHNFVQYGFRVLGGATGR